MSKVYMGQIMAECDCQHSGCEQRGYCMADRIEELEAKLATCEKYRDAYAECDRIGTQAVRDLEANLAKAMDALAGVDNFVRDLSPFADPSHSPATALARACEVYAELTGGKDE